MSDQSPLVAMTPDGLKAALRAESSDNETRSRAAPREAVEAAKTGVTRNAPLAIACCFSMLPRVHLSR